MENKVYLFINIGFIHEMNYHKILTFYFLLIGNSLRDFSKQNPRHINVQKIYQFSTQVITFFGQE